MNDGSNGSCEDRIYVFGCGNGDVLACEGGGVFLSG